MRHTLHLLQGHRRETGVVLVAVGVAQPVQFVQGRAQGVGAQVLPADLLLADDLGLGPVQFLRGQPFGPEQRDLLENLALDLGDLLRLGPGVEREVARRQAQEILRADVLGQAQFLPDAHEEP